MTANRERMYWHSNKEWWFYNDKTEKIELTEKHLQKLLKALKNGENRKKENF